MTLRWKLPTWMNEAVPFCAAVLAVKMEGPVEQQQGQTVIKLSLSAMIGAGCALLILSCCRCSFIHGFKFSDSVLQIQWHRIGAASASLMLFQHCCLLCLQLPM